MDHSLLKNLLEHEFYLRNKAKLRASLFDDTMLEVYEAITSSHDKFGIDITAVELFAHWKSTHPTATTSWAAEVEDLVGCISSAEPISDAIATDVIENLWRQSVGLDIANLGLLMSEGESSAMDRLNTLLDRVSDGYLPDDFGDGVTDDIYELLAVTSNDNRFKFNIETLSRHVYGIGAKVVYICNEEIAKRTKLRAIGSYTGMTREEIDLDPSAAAARYSGIKDRLIFVDAQGWDIQTLEGFLNKEKPDICMIDMADKIELHGNFNSGHERLRELYFRLRECAKKFDCAILGNSQCSAEAEGKTRITMSMMEGSKVGKAAECDVMLGIGRINSGEDDNDPSRWITVMKNKISGWHGTVQCNLEAEVNRYVV